MGATIPPQYQLHGCHLGRAQTGAPVGGVAARAQQRADIPVAFAGIGDHPGARGGAGRGGCALDQLNLRQRQGVGRIREELIKPDIIADPHVGRMLGWRAGLDPVEIGRIALGHQEGFAAALGTSDKVGLGRPCAVISMYQGNRVVTRRRKGPVCKVQLSITVVDEIREFGRSTRRRWPPQRNPAVLAFPNWLG